MAKHGLKSILSIGLDSLSSISMKKKGIERIMTSKLKLSIELIKELILAILAALLILNFLMFPTKVPTESMMPTINPHDHLIVNRIAYIYSNPKRGDIIVFKLNGDKLIKRVIGQPGDVVDIIENRVYINGKRLDENAYLGPFENTYLYAGSKVTFPYIVPENYYFVMGDNRKNSKDSRVFGPIARETILARAGFRIYPFNRMGNIK